MTGRHEGPPDLTTEQLAVVSRPVEAKVLVTAGPGAGKTHTLVSRLDALLASGEVAAGEILVLTFSRAATLELGSRLARYGEAARHVRARTFDAWALELLVAVDADTDWRSRSFDDRIAAAGEAIDDGLADDLYEDDLLHVVIDEVQDLVDVRRGLVESLLGRFDTGFTVVGDPAQSIYGFQVLDPAERAKETGRFITWLRNTFGDELVQLELTGNFRARTPEAEVALGFGARLNAGAAVGSGEDGGPGLYAELRARLLESPDFGDLSMELVQGAVRDFPGTTALLCRDNGQALVASELLYGGGVVHRLRRRTGDQVAPAWLAQLFGIDDGSVHTRAAFDSSVTSGALTGIDDPDRVWVLLSRLAGSGGGRAVDRARLSAALGRRLPDELTASASAAVTVSSIHRAKGLEFDRVVVVKPTADRGGHDVDAGEEARLLYVAMTRAREELMHASPLDTVNVRRCTATGRWARYGWKGHQRFGFELLGGDVHADDPAGTTGFVGEPPKLQDYLRHEVGVGDEVVVLRDEGSLGGDDLPPRYGVFHRGLQIGVLSDAFREDLHRHLKRWRSYTVRGWPREITGARVDAIETVVGGEAAGRIAGLGEYGVWLAPRLSGLTRFMYDRADSGPETDD